MSESKARFTPRPPGVVPFDRPSSRPYQSRSVTLGTRGMVATSHPLAAQTGLDVLRAGGTAVDAAIAANAMLGVVEPMSCGIGGDLFAIVWDAHTGGLSGLNASGRSPRGLSVDAVRDLGLSLLPETGPLSWSVPGCVDGWQHLLGRYGRKPLAELLQPAIQTARDGFPVSDIIAHSWESAADGLAACEDTARVYLPDGRAPREGEVFRNPALARCYERIAAEGAAAFYHGDIADQIVRFSRQQGGWLSHDDFTGHRSDPVDPVGTNYRGVDVWELPPNGQGIAALQMLNILEEWDVAGWGPLSLDYLHHLVEAKKLAFADRARFYADPEFSPAPVAELISKEYAARQRKRIDSLCAAADVPHGHPRLEHGDTVYITAVDQDRNCCSLIQSNYFGFGSLMAPAGLGFVLQNRGCSFTLEEGHPNRLEPGKRPFHTIIPGFATRNGRPWLCFGVMGGDMQPQGHVQVLINMIDFGMNVQQAGDATRVRHLGSQTPRGEPMQTGGGAVAVETGVPLEVIRGLEARGHRITTSPGAFGGYQAILIDPETGVLHGGTDPRKDGVACGW